jgi:hypothetical protein
MTIISVLVVNCHDKRDGRVTGNQQAVAGKMATGD